MTAASILPTLRSTTGIPDSQLMALRCEFPAATQRDISNAWTDSLPILQMWLFPHGGGESLVSNPNIESARYLFVCFRLAHSANRRNAYKMAAKKLLRLSA